MRQLENCMRLAEKNNQIIQHLMADLTCGNPSVDSPAGTY